MPEHFKDCFVSGNTRRNIFLMMKECLHNSVKHAQAKSISIKAVIGSDLQLIISDDGKGFSTTEEGKGNGLINMKKRIQELNGTIRFENNKGMTVITHLPLNTNQRTIV